MRVLSKTVLNRSERQARHIREYVESQASDEGVKHLEKVTSERIFGRQYDVWDVWTDKERWWVITSPTNLYRQKDYVSMDYTLSFHVGVTARVMARHEPPVEDHDEQRLAAAWRRWRQAGEALDKADEAEDFQAVGMRCRECLLELAQAAARDNLVSAGRQAPARGDFVQWTELIAGAVSPGESGDALRGYLKTTAKATWQLVNWLTHARNAHRPDALIALHATESVLVDFGTAVTRRQGGTPERCPSCFSYRIASDFRSDLDSGPGYVSVCESCGWTDSSPAA
jgi:hypothetical protein